MPFAAKHFGPVFGLLVAMAVTAGCEEQIDVRGNYPDPKVLATIKPGQTNRATVEQMLGTPSTVATFDQETWYYVGGRVKTISFLKPELLERKVVAIQFSRNGVVEEVRQLDADDGKQVAIVNRETPTKGKELTLIQQLIGNIGRFGGDQKPPDQNTGPSPGGL